MSFPVSSRWYPALTQSHQDALQFVVSSGVGGTLIYSSPIFINAGSTSPLYVPGTAPGANQPRPAIIDGAITFSKSATFRSTLSMKLVDTTGLLVPVNSAGALTPWGNEMSIYRGIAYADGTLEMPLLGVFRITDVVIDDAQGAPTLAIQGTDRSRIISRNTVIDYYQSGLSEAYTDIIRDMALSRYPSVTFNDTAANWRLVPPAGIGAGGGIVSTDALVPLIYQEGTDLWVEMKKLANAMACDLYFDRHGVLTLVLDPNMNYTLASLPTIPTPVATFVEGSQARFIRTQRTLSDKDAYNQQVVTGEGQVIGASLNPIRSVPAQDTDPSSPTYINGPYGVVNGFETNTLMRTQAQVNLFAQYKLRVSAGAQEQVAFDGFADSSLDVDDAIGITRARVGLPNNSFIIDSAIHPLIVKNPMQVTLRERRSLA